MVRRHLDRSETRPLEQTREIKAIRKDLEAFPADDSITFAKMQNIATDRLIGRDTAGSGDPEEISVGNGLEFTGSAGIGVANNGITYARMQDVTATARLIGRKTSGSGDPEELTFTEALDLVGSSAEGDILYRGSSAWSRLPKGTALQVLRQNTALTAPEWATAREVLSANRTYYVRTDGSDSNTGLVDSAGGAFLTIQKAYDTICGTIDVAGKTVTIQSSGTTTSGLNMTQGWVGAGAITIDLGSGTWSTTSDDCISCTCVIPGTFTVQTGTVQTTTSGSCIIHQGVGTITVGANITWGATATFHAAAFAAGATIEISAASTITGGAAAHYYGNNLGLVRDVSHVTTVSASVTFSSGFAFGRLGGVVNANGSTYSLGAFTVTGQRYNCDVNAVIFTNAGGASFFPGTVAGSAGTTGVYA